MQRWLKWTLGTIIVLVALDVGGHYGLSALYHGPQSTAEVTTAMPEVPLFPFVTMAPGNRAAQRGMAAPLWLMRRQGVQRAETAVLLATADAEFVRDWHLRALPEKGWTFAANQPLGRNTRLLFLKDRRAVQVIISPAHDLFVAYQLVYLDGLSPQQVHDLMLTGTR